MCVLSQLKKKLHLQKLMQFLKQYQYIVFFHSNKGHQLRDEECVTYSKKVIFLVKSGRICQQSQSLVNPKNFAQIGQCISKIKGSTYNGNPLKLVASGGALGSIFLVGCSCLEDLQRVMHQTTLQSKVKIEKNIDWVCLGAVCDNTFKDHLDCQRLSEMHLSIKSAQEKSVHTLGQVQYKCLIALLQPQITIHLTLMAASKATPSPTDAL